MADALGTRTYKEKRSRDCVRLRSDGKQTFLVVANFGDTADISVRIPPEALNYLGIKAVRTVYTITVSAWDFAVVQVQ